MTNKFFEENYEDSTDKKIMAKCFLIAYENAETKPFEEYQIKDMRYYLEKIEEKPNEMIYKRKLSSLINTIGFEKIRDFIKDHKENLKKQQKDDNQKDNSKTSYY